MVAIQPKHHHIETELFPNAQQNQHQHCQAVLPSQEIGEILIELNSALTGPSFETTSEIPSQLLPGK